MYVHGIAQQSDIQLLLLLLLTLSHQEAVTRDPVRYLEVPDPPKKYLFGSLEPSAETLVGSWCLGQTKSKDCTGTSSHGGDIQLQMTSQGSQARATLNSWS
ncbi:hypothetical protein B0H11DRAFT_2047233, partial [Mycena galericulata]